MNLNSIGDELIALADVGVKKAISLGVDEAEIFASSIEIVAAVNRGGISQTRQGFLAGVGVRVVKERRIGFSCSSTLDESGLRRCIEEACGLTRIQRPDSQVKQLPARIPRQSRDGFIDEKIVEFSGEDALRLTTELAGEAASHNSSIVSVSGRLNVSRGAFAVANSWGVQDCSKFAFMSGSLSCSARREKRKISSMSFASRRLTDLRGIGISVAERAKTMLNAHSLNASLKSTVVWENLSVANLLASMIDHAVNASYVQDGRSMLCEKLGAEMASNALTIFDDGQDKEGLATYKVDFEGVPRQRTLIIERGVLKSFLYDSHSAFKGSKLSTGNAFRELPEPFASPPSISISNLVVQPGRKDLPELIEDVDKGILVSGAVLGVGQANDITGDFNIVAPNAFIINRGEVSKPLNPITINGNFYFILREIREIGADIHLLQVGKIPSIVFEDLMVSG
jgi:PmbA protein